MSIVGLLNDGHMSKVISNYVKAIADQFLEEYADEINTAFTSVAVNLLDGTSALDMLGVIQGIQNSCETENAAH